MKKVIFPLIFPVLLLTIVACGKQEITLKNKQGTSITFKKENVSCRSYEWNPTFNEFSALCTANGVATDLAKKTYAYSSNKRCINMSTWISCIAAKEFGIKQNPPIQTDFCERNDTINQCIERTDVRKKEKVKLRKAEDSETYIWGEEKGRGWFADPQRAKVKLKKAEVSQRNYIWDETEERRRINELRWLSRLARSDEEYESGLERLKEEYEICKREYSARECSYDRNAWENLAKKDKLYWKQNFGLERLKEEYEICKREYSAKECSYERNAWEKLAKKDKLYWIQNFLLRRP